MTILLAEDNSADVGLVRMALEEHGVEGELIVTADGERALKYLDAVDRGLTACPNLAIIDLNLPRRSGVEVAEAFRASAKCATVPIAILSSSDAKQDRDAAVLLHADQYICKPSHLDEFLKLGRSFKLLAAQKANS